IHALLPVPQRCRQWQGGGARGVAAGSRGDCRTSKAGAAGRPASRCLEAIGMNFRLSFLSCCTLAVSALAGCDRPAAPPAATPAVSPPELAMVGAHLLEGLGDLHFPVSSAQPEVQRWFDQG